MPTSAPESSYFSAALCTVHCAGWPGAKGQPMHRPSTVYTYVQSTPRVTNLVPTPARNPRHAEATGARARRCGAPPDGGITDRRWSGIRLQLCEQFVIGRPVMGAIPPPPPPTVSRRLPRAWPAIHQRTKGPGEGSVRFRSRGAVGCIWVGVAERWRLYRAEEMRVINGGDSLRRNPY